MQNANKKEYSISKIFKSHWFTIPIVAVAYIIAARLSQLVKIPPGEISPVFAASGIALAAVIIFRKPALFGVFLGSFLNNTISYQPSFAGVLITIAIGIGATSGAGAGAYLVKSYCKNLHPLASGKNIIILVFFGAVIACAISPSIGVLTLSLMERIPWEYSFSSFINWWVGDASGVIIVAPFILAWNMKSHYSKILLNGMEALLLMIATLVLCYYVFIGGLQFDYFLSLLLMYAAFRFNIRIVSGMALVIAIFATIGTSMGTSLYAGNSANITLIHLISFLSVSIVSALVLAGIVTERKLALLEIERYQNNLEMLVAERTNDLESANEELKAANEELYSKNEIIDEQNSELKTTMQHLQETQSHLIQAEKMASLGVLTAGVAHEINNPLNFIMGGYMGLNKYYIKTGGYNDENVPIFLNSIKAGLDRASDIVKGLNQFSRNNETLTEECNIHSIIDNCLLMLNNQLKNRIEVHKDYTSQEVTISGNVGKLHQVFINILSNSSQSIDNNGSIAIKTYKQTKNIIIEISDSGCGISMENLSKITDPFFTTKDPGKGTGLGLSISYRIIKDHQGKIEFQSEINKGTTVKITFSIDNYERES